MSIQEDVQYLANLTSLLDHFEKVGAPKNKWVLAEFNFANDEFLKTLKEKHNETRPSVVQGASGPEAGTKEHDSKPSGSSGDRVHSDPPSGANLQGKGASSTLGW